MPQLEAKAGAEQPAPTEATGELAAQDAPVSSGEPAQPAEPTETSTELRPRPADGSAEAAQEPAPTTPTTPTTVEPAAPPVDDPVDAEPEGKMAKNTIYGELLGPGGVYSFNYERSIPYGNLRVGASYISIDGISLAIFPIGANYTGIGGRDHHLELGGTLSIAILSASTDTLVGNATGALFVPIAGYRFQPYDGGFNFRIGASPLLGPGGALPWGYLSVGATF